ncbi:MAG: hypothetical protein II612_03970 [Prevotella sp.]|nr:hypothetical protein [Prevotella sp.]
MFRRVVALDCTYSHAATFVWVGQIAAVGMDIVRSDILYKCCSDAQIP